MLPHLPPPKKKPKLKPKKPKQKSEDQIYLLYLLKKNVSAMLPCVFEHSQYLLILSFKLE